MEQRPQRQGYADLNERQEEGVPALEEDQAAGRPTQLPDLGMGGASGSDSDLTRRADTDAGRDDTAPRAGDRGGGFGATEDAGKGLGGNGGERSS